MKSVIRSFISCSLALVLAAAPLTALASVALGDDLDASSYTVNRSTELHSGTFWSNAYSDLREENYVTYKPNSRVTPIVTCGDYVTQLSTVSAAALNLEQQGYRVVAGINGDYYDTETNVPLGSVMTNGVLRNVINANYAIGFYDDGTTVMGNPQLTIRAASEDGSSFGISALNYVRASSSGIYLYDSTFNARHSTGTSESGYDVICNVLDGSLSIGGSVSLMVSEIRPEAKDTLIGENQYVLTANLHSAEGVQTLSTLQEGQILTLSVSANDSKWNKVTNLIGALYLLVDNGTVCSGLPTGAAPRTAVGLRADGSIVLYTIDGRRSGYSIGASLSQVAERLVELGCVTALSLDGGGSTTLVTTVPTDTTASVANKPSGNTSRAVTNHLFLVASSQRSGGTSHVYLDAESHYVLPNGQVNLTVAALDSNYIPTSSSVSLRASSGTIEGTTYTAPAVASGNVTIRASAGGETQELTLCVVSSPDSISVKQNDAAVTALSLGRGDSVHLSASALYRHLPVAGDNSGFRWSVTGNVGSIDQSGNFTAANRVANGSIIVSLGSVSVTIPVSVTADPLVTLDSFESAFSDIYGINAVFSRSTDNYSRGKAGAKLDYTCAPDSPASISLNYAVSSKYDHLNFWVLGDGKNAALTFTTDCGSTEPVLLDFTTWKNLSVSLPYGSTRITGVTISSEWETDGSICLDQFVLSYDGLIDTTAPVITLSYDEQSLSVSGTILDDCDGASASMVRVTYDGSIISYNLSSDGQLSFTPPVADGKMHRITVYAADHSGNLSRKSLDVLPGELTPAFSDTAEHWADSYVGYLKSAGVTTGDENGNFNPNANISRQEFAVLLYRFLKPGVDCSSVVLPFADKNEIASWAYDGVCAMYALGITKGTVNGMGESVFSPTSTISRQEAVTMIGRLLEKGYASPVLTFRDTSSIASWAYDYVSTLNHIGILSGDTDGRFYPNKSMTRAQVAKVLYKIL